VPKTLDDGFRSFIDGVTPDSDMPDVPEDFRERIMDCLNDDFGLYAFFLGGSLLSGTHLRGYDGVDYFASLDEGQLPSNSDLFLGEVGRVLGACFTDRDVTVQAPAVVVPIDPGGGRVIRVVPARLAGRTPAGHCLYAVADGLGDWMTSSPDAHSAYVEALDSDREDKLRPLIRIIKAWKRFRDVPVSSFYLELQCVTHVVGERMIVYTVDVRNVFELLWQDQFADVHDPKGISGLVPARLTYAGKKTAIARLRTALYHVSRAQEAAEAGNVEEAFVYWNRTFRGHFPAYG
jgi:hypothetical protein